MSRIPKQPPPTPSKRLGVSTSKPSPSISSPRLRSTKSTPKLSSKVIEPPIQTKPALSLKEIIALRRAEAKKVQTNFTQGGEDASELPEKDLAKDAEDDSLALGRLSIRETVERARSTGR